MPVEEQGLDRSRYHVIPRTLIFLRRGADEYLLLKGAPQKTRFAGLYNGLGGHVERGEDLLSAARREVREECGLEADLWLCGTVMVDVAEDFGITLFVFSGRPRSGGLRPSAEGQAEWIRLERVPALPALPDLLPLLQRVHGMRRGAAPFSARSGYDAEGHLQIHFAA